MKTLKRLAVGQLNDLERLSMRELSNFVGGSGCLWDALGYAYTFCDDLEGEFANEGDPKATANYANGFKKLWERRGGLLNENGDPSPEQKDLLFDVISEEFGTTGSTWGSSGWYNMINGSSCGMALVMVGDDMNQHACIISGTPHSESLPGGGERLYYMAENNPNEKIYVDTIQYGTGLSKKNK